MTDGTVSIEADLIPVEGITRLIAERIFAPAGIHLACTVEFLGGGIANGELDLTRTP